MSSFFRKLLIAAGIVAGLFTAGIVAIIRPDLSVETLKKKYAGPDSRYFEFEGMQVHYSVEGSGEPVLLLHGTFASLHTFDGWATALRDSFQVIRLDLPGFGLTGPHPDDDYRVESTLVMLDSLRRILEVERWHVGGNSLGGRLAYAYARQFPDRISSLVLIDAAGFPEPLEPQTAPSSPRPSSDRAFVFKVAGTPLLQHLLTVCTPKFWFKATLEQVYGDPARITEETVTRYYELMRREGNRRAFLKRGQSGKVFQERMLPERASDTTSRYPVLIMWGEKDRWIPLANAYRYQQAIPNARLMVYPDAGHVPMEELPEVTARDVKQFLLQGF